MHKKFYSSYCFLLFLINTKFSFLPIIKMNANYAEICRLGNLESDFQKSSAYPLFFFSNFSQYFCETSIGQIQQRKVKTKYFFRQ